MLDGFSPGTADALYRALDERTRNDVLAGRGVVLTQNLGKTLNVRVGDQLRLQTPHGPQQVTVLALVPYFSTVIGTVGMDLDQMRAWFDRPAATTLQIAAAPGVDPNRLLPDVRRVVPAPNYRVRRPHGVGRPRGAAASEHVHRQRRVDHRGVGCRRRTFQHVDPLRARTAPRNRCAAGDGIQPSVHTADGPGRGGGHRCRRRGPWGFCSA